VPTFGYQQGIGIGSTGFDSSNGAKRKANASKPSRARNRRDQVL
jgi:hypothetical protein